MDQHEAEQLVRAIERTHVTWLTVERIVFNESGKTYELECRYRKEAALLGKKAVWEPRRICAPRAWIELLTLHRDTQ
jgi:hypothetical protein